jgi:hypothetical protein
MFSFYGLYGMPIRRRGGPKKKKTKPRKASWFEECTAPQLKELCKACKLPVSGSKGDLVSRLQQNDFCSHFGGNKRSNTSMRSLINGTAHHGNVVSVDDLKEMCRARLLTVSGTKFDLVLRICQHENGTGGDTLKRAATETVVDEESGVEKQVAKKRKPNKPSPSTFYTRVQKKIEACATQKKYQSHWGSKGHAPDVCSLMEQLISSCNEYLESDSQLVCDCYYSIISSFVENFKSFQRPGYCEDLESMADTIERNLLRVWERLSAESIERMADIMTDWKSIGDPYGLLMDYDMDATVKALLAGPNSKLSPSNATVATAATHNVESEEDEEGDSE